MSVAARKTPGTDGAPESGEDIPREAPRAPTLEAWAAMTPAEQAMTPAEQDAAEEALIASVSQEEIDERDAMAEGDPHLDAKMEARDTLRAYYGGNGRRSYVGADIKVYYPGEKGFTPDILAVTDVEVKPRVCWMVHREGKGVDLALEVHYAGDRRKDFVTNVTRYAALGTREYFAYDLRRGLLKGHRLPSAGARAYRDIPRRLGRYRSEVLELDLALEGGRLRFYAGTAELFTAAEHIGKLEKRMEAVELRADRELLRAEQAIRQMTSAILAFLRMRGVEVGEDVERRVLECDDPEVLGRWLQRSASVTRAEELFEGPEEPGGGAAAS